MAMKTRIEGSMHLDMGKALPAEFLLAFQIDAKGTESANSSINNPKATTVS